MEIEIKPVTSEVRFSQNFSLARNVDNSSNGWNDLYMYILAGIGLAALGITAYIILENSKNSFGKMRIK